MAEFESGWQRHPDYRIDLVPCDARVRVWHGDTLLAESDRCIRLEEQHHVDRLYVPKDDVRWEHFELAKEKQYLLDALPQLSMTWPASRPPISPAGVAERS